MGGNGANGRGDGEQVNLISPHARQVMSSDKSEQPQGTARYDVSVEAPPAVTRARELKLHMADAQKLELKRMQTEFAHLRYRASNQYSLQALDHALAVGLGMPLSAFAGRPVQALEPTEERYFLSPAASKSCPGYLETDDPGRKRSCIIDRASGKRRLEVSTQIDASGEKQILPPCLHLCIGRGSSGFPGAMWLYGRQKLRGCLFGDWCHDEWNALKNAACAANVWLPLLERMVVLILPSGPWDGAAFFSKVKTTGIQFFRDCSP